MVYGNTRVHHKPSKALQIKSGKECQCHRAGHQVKTYHTNTRLKLDHSYISSTYGSSFKWKGIISVQNYLEECGLCGLL